MMRIISWNVNGRGDQLTQQLDAVLMTDPDVVALQEVVAATFEPWQKGLSAAGYSVVSGVELAGRDYPAPPYPSPPFPKPIGRQIRRRTFNLTAARHPITALDGLRFDDREHAKFAFPEKFVAAEVSLSGRVIEVHNAHAPPGVSRHLIKPQMLAAVVRRIDERSDLPQVLCGDFNTPRHEEEGKPATTWAPPDPEVREMWDAAERSILEHPRLHDAYKQVHRAGEPWPYSHVTGATERRYDHIYVTDDFTVGACRYRTDWLAEGLSDHAAVDCELDLAR